MAAEADFYVAATGSDKNLGTIDKPFKTLDKARVAVREKIADGLKKDITVLIRGGTYQLNEPLVFSQKDSGLWDFIRLTKEWKKIYIAK